MKSVRRGGPANHRRVLLWAMVPTLIFASLSLHRPAALQRLEYIVFDTMVRAAATRPPGDDIIIVDIDERSLASFGQWPWPRDIMGRLISTLRDSGAGVIALDIIFAEADRHAGLGARTDAALADALKGGRVVLGYALTFDVVAESSDPCVGHPLSIPVVHRGDDQNNLPLFRATSAICNLPALTQAANASGFLNAAPDPDGILRRAPLLMQFNGHLYPSLAVAALSAMTGSRDTALHVANVNTAWLALDARTVPLDGKGNLLLRFRGPKRTFPYVSAADVLSGKLPSPMFADKLVFVGTTALGTREVVATPLDTLFVGVEVQATIADNLLQQDFIRRPEHGVAIETQAVIAAGLIGAAAVGWLGLAWGSCIIFICMASMWTGAVWMLSSDGRFLSPLFPTAGLAGSLAAMTVARFTIERTRADKAGEETAASKRLMLRTLLSLTETRDADTGRHSRRTENFTRALATKLAEHPEFATYLTPERIELFASLAPLHDIGKVGVPDRVLNKPGVLTPEEREEMKKHPSYGRDVILRAQRDVGAIDDEILRMAKDIVYTHHEKWDGTGYPQGLIGTQIPIVGRVMAVVDVYDAMMTRRAYHAPMTHEQAISFVVSARGTHFDPDVVNAFINVSEELKILSADGDS